jgi:Ser/Thr protein kinase RdoA (MazF antagonist)
MSVVDSDLTRQLIPAGRWQPAVSLGERLKRRLAEPSLDWGICHMDLSLDNVHRAENVTVFDFDSAGTCWRAVEPWAVLRSTRQLHAEGSA